MDAIHGMDAIPSITVFSRYERKIKIPILMQISLLAGRPSSRVGEGEVRGRVQMCDRQ